MKYFKKIVGERLYLSPINKDDVEIFTKWMNDKEITDRLHGTFRIITIEAEEKWVESAQNGYNFSMVLNDDTLIGNISLMNVNEIDGTATIGLFIGEKDNRGKGYGSEALKLILNFGFNVLRLHNIKLDVFDFNENAIACYKKVGFKEYARRHECYFLDGKYHDELSLEILDRDFNK